MTRTFSRGHLIAVAASALLLAAPCAMALDALKILAPAAPGGGWDQTARSMQRALQSGDIVKRVTVDNKAGAGGTIGLAQFINSSKGDPQALMVGGTVMVGAILVNGSPVNLSQVTPIARLTGEYEVIVVPAASRIQKLSDLVVLLKANPGAVSWGGGSAGATDHLLAAMVAQAAGVDPGKINYIAHAGGGEAQAAILGGHVTVGVSGWGEFAAQVKAGKLRALGISAAERLPDVKDVPTLKEQGVDVVLANWRALFGAPGTSEAQKAELVAAVDKAVKTPSWKETLDKNEWNDLYLSGDAFKAFLETEQPRIAKVVSSLGMIKK
ncbi:tripartite tricarboxylate transporter substrate binding protein [Rhizobacter sp. Root1221]|uniref:Bug family tripartite tricarboxylate transporter substrate binding protein n=1 Tax=Rhizobacter sp. Root1221 TaxID=1736433 RepID=UPI0006F671BD|nr:tripartite tricarboxylate transporter substrate binding protein [Rhizobacter sp. Root1221]KQW00806.1 C4-dicarboxylate ABC transporter substrate-binding protein [Rhizobacter sp. Root1221]